MSAPNLGVKLVLGDFFQEVSSIPDASIDLAIVDPPYFLSNGTFTVSSGKATSVHKGEWDHATPEQSSFAFHHQWIIELKRVLKPHGALVVSGTYHSIYECGFALGLENYRVLNEIAWFKPNGAPNLSGRRLAASHESIIWATTGPNSKYTFNYEDLKSLECPGDQIKKPGKQMRSVWWIASTPSRERKFGHHPTQKPEALIDRIVKAFSKAGDTILDPFMGSGTSGVVSLRNGRRFIGIEKDADYFKIAQERIGETSND